MNFSEKLSFLMNITSTSNKQLADALAVDPSLISLFKTGRREPKKDNTHIKKIAAFFAKRCQGNYQRIALSEAMGRRGLQMLMSTEELSTVIYDWLISDSSLSKDFLSTFDSFKFSNNLNKKRTPKVTPEISLPESSNFAYYGNEGRRGAFSAFLSYLLLLDTPGTILFSSDESNDWLFEDKVYFEQVREQTRLIFEKGFVLRRIASPIQSVEDAFDTISNMLPFYTSGKIESYFYPHMRDNIYRRTVLVLPNVASLLSTSIGNSGTIRATIFTQDKRFTEAIAEEFNDYLKKCRPVFNEYNTLEDASGFYNSLSNFYKCKGECIMQSGGLSGVTTPEEITHLVAEALPREDSEAIVDTMAHSRLLFRENLENYKTIDIQGLAVPKDLRAGIVPISISYLRPTSCIFHTTKTYIMHLQSILNTMEDNENYNAVLLPWSPGTTCMMVKNGEHARIIKAGIPISIYDIIQPGVPAACREYLLQIANSKGPYEKQRQETMLKIWQAIQELKYD